MMNLSENMDLKNLRNSLAKAQWHFEFILPPAKAGGNSKGNLNMILI